MPLDPDYLRRQLGLPPLAPDVSASNPEMMGKSSPDFGASNFGSYYDPQNNSQPQAAPTYPASQPDSSAAPTVQPANPYASPYDQRIGDLEKQYADVATTPAQKQNPWLQGAFLALEGIRNFATPQNAQPIQWLGEAKRQYKLGQVGSQLEPLYGIRNQEEKTALGRVQRENIIQDNKRQQQQIDDLKQYRQDTIDERRALRQSTDANAKMKTVASMLSKIPEYDPSDPRFNDITKALGDVGLPLAPKDVRKKVQLIQDADTGAWTMTLTDPISGRQEVRPVNNKDGSQLVTTSTAKVSANAAAGRQTAQFAQDDKKQQVAAQLQQALKDHDADLAEQKATSDQKRKMEIQDRIDQRAKMIKQLQGDLSNLLGGDNQQ